MLVILVRDRFDYIKTLPQRSKILEKSYKKYLIKKNDLGLQLNQYPFYR